MNSPRDRDREKEMYVPRLNIANAAPFESLGNKSLKMEEENGVITDWVNPMACKKY